MQRFLPRHEPPSHLHPRGEAEGLAWLRRSVEVGNEDAPLTLARALIDGLASEPRPDEGRALLEGVAKKGNREAMAILAGRLLRGDGLPAEPKAGVLKGRWSGA